MKRVGEFSARSADGRKWQIEIFLCSSGFGRLGKWLEPRMLLRTRTGSLPVSHVGKGIYDIHGHGGSVLRATSDSPYAP